jgi:hypothetical protein
MSRRQAPPSARSRASRLRRGGTRARCAHTHAHTHAYTRTRTHTHTHTHTHMRLDPLAGSGAGGDLRAGRASAQPSTTRGRPRVLNPRRTAAHRGSYPLEVVDRRPAAIMARTYGRTKGSRPNLKRTQTRIRPCRLGSTRRTRITARIGVGPADSSDHLFLLLVHLC